VRERWPNVKFMEAYGTTEVPVVSIADFDNPEFDDAGPPAVYTTLKILDPESGAELPRGRWARSWPATSSARITS
jgi:long-subunit acyl-CoA synthetase (AMP-forming)